ncbi:MAG: hypothetical protein ACOYBO_01070 [Azonexus sp.]
MDFKFEFDGVDETTGVLERIRNLKRLYGQMEIAVKNLQFVLKYYPPRATNLHVEFKTEKQRRYFFWALHEGKIDVPYRRTRTLGKRWTTKVEYINGGVTGVVGNVTPYAPYVQSRADQAKVHEGRWGTAEDAMENLHDQIYATLGEAFAVEG